MVRFVLGEIICRADQHFLFAIPVEIDAKDTCNSHFGICDSARFQEIADCLHVNGLSGISDYGLPRQRIPCAASPITPSLGFDESETVNVSGHGSSTDFGLPAVIWPACFVRL